MASLKRAFTAARRWVAGLLTKAAFHVSPDPPDLTFTIKRVVEIDPNLIADAISGSMGRGIVGRSFTPGGGEPFAY